jgi:hypothetical protein
LLVLELHCKALIFIIEIESKFFLKLGTNKTLLKFKELPGSSWKGTVPTPSFGYLALLPLQEVP